MTFSKVPWLVDGPITKAELGRVALFAATSGAGGIVGSGDCRVLATTSPSGSVRVTRGSVLVVSRYPGARNETYVMDNDADDLVPVPPTGSTGRSDLVVARVIDPQYEGGQPSNPDTFQYADARLVSNVSSSRKDADDFDGPFEALARIDIPPNTSVFTQAMIADLRRVARPRKDRLLRGVALTTSQAQTLTSTAAGGQGFPTYANAPWKVDVPSWATRAKLIANWDGLFLPGGNARGELWAGFGTGGLGYVYGQRTGYNTDGVTSPQRTGYGAFADVAVPLNMRGQTVDVGLFGNTASDSSAGARLKIDGGTSVRLDIEFSERATSDV